MCVRRVGTAALPPSAAAEEKETLEHTAAQLHERVWTIDTHVDTPMRLTGQGFDIGVRHDVRARGGRVDLPRMKAGGLDAVFFAVYLDQGPRTAEANERAKQEALQIFEAIHQAIAQYPDQAALATASDDAEPLEQQGQTGDLYRHRERLRDRPGPVVAADVLRPGGALCHVVPRQQQ